MTDTIKLKLNGESHEVETKPLTLICHDGTQTVEVDDSSVMRIDPQMTVAAADKVTESFWESLRVDDLFLLLWKLVFTDSEPPTDLKKSQATGWSGRSDD